MKDSDSMRNQTPREVLDGDMRGMSAPGAGLVAAGDGHLPLLQ